MNGSNVDPEAWLSLRETWDVLGHWVARPLYALPDPETAGQVLIYTGFFSWTRTYLGTGRWSDSHGGTLIAFVADADLAGADQSWSAVQDRVGDKVVVGDTSISAPTGGDMRRPSVIADVFGSGGKTGETMGPDGLPVHHIPGVTMDDGPPPQVLRKAGG